MNNLLDFFLKVKASDRSTISIIGWWEIRRFLYNSIVLITGLISLTIMHALVNLKPGEDLQEPLTIFIFAILCNICYTLGWIVEIGSKGKFRGPMLFKVGLYFTLFWIFLPAVLHIVFWVERGFVKLN